MDNRNPEEYGRLSNVTLQVTLLAKSLYERDGEVDGALIVEHFDKTFTALFPVDYVHDKGFHTWLTACIQDGKERALVIEYDALLERHGLPGEDASELLAGDDLTPEARADLSAFLLRWEAAGL